ncbi:hypothetical protein HY642_02330 [Candidatus Woesearchaeota archaeon]|nr:hypothetical protein [Candidatus Woesearchaeota archaeon]
MYSAAYGGQGTGNYQPAHYQHFALEQIVAPYVAASIEKEAPIVLDDAPSYASARRTSSTESQTTIYTPSYHFTTNDFLLANRPSTHFVAGFDDDLKQHVNDAFKATTGTALPRNITIVLCDKPTLKLIHDRFGWWNEGIQGFSLNRFGHGISEIFVREGPLDEVMLTIGHELGHVLSPKLPSDRDEEAKAFAFSLAWMEAIVENNIAGLQHSINPRPANNGVHDVAFAFVRELMSSSEAGRAFMDIATGKQSLERQVELIVR